MNGYFREEIRMVNKHMIKHSTLSVIRETQTKFQWDNIIYLLVNQNYQNQQYQELEKMRSNWSSQTLLVGIQIGTASLENIFTFF